jgi:hypothetical protein
MVAAAIVGGAVIGGIATSSAGSDAADAQVEAANTASATSLEATREQIAANRAIYDQNRADSQPWRDAGTEALTQMRGGTQPGGDYNRDFTLSDFHKDPGYQFRMDQGTQALERSAAARGGLMSGGTGKALQQYGQDYATGEYSNAYNRFNTDRTTRFNRLASIAGDGQTATRRTIAQPGHARCQHQGQPDGADTIAGAAGNASPRRAAHGRRASRPPGTRCSGGAGNIGNYFMMRQFLGNGGGGYGTGGGIPPNPYDGRWLQLRGCRGLVRWIAALPGPGPATR